MSPAERVKQAVTELASQFLSEGQGRRERTSLARADFEALADCGMLGTGLPEANGGLYRSPAKSVRLFCELFRILGRGDSSVALVSTMHPSVLTFWMHGTEPEPEYKSAWEAQLERIVSAVSGGHWFGTIASEPGANGDLMATRCTATQDASGRWRMSGDKFMGSGSGVTSYMLTVARPDGEDTPDVFLMDVREQSWDGSGAMKLVREWDGMGMCATQSHAFRFDDMPVERYACPGAALAHAPAILPMLNCLFSAVTLGILDAAVETARSGLRGRAATMKSYERTCWVNAENQYWLAIQALEGMVSAVERGDAAMLAASHGKLAIAELAESCMSALSRAVGGRAYTRSAPFAQLGQDIRALGYLRPPWPLAYDSLVEQMAAPTE